MPRSSVRFHLGVQSPAYPALTLGPVRDSFGAGGLFVLYVVRALDLPPPPHIASRPRRDFVRSRAVLCCAVCFPSLMQAGGRPGGPSQRDELVVGRAAAGRGPRHRQPGSRTGQEMLLKIPSFYFGHALSSTGDGGPREAANHGSGKSSRRLARRLGQRAIRSPGPGTESPAAPLAAVSPWRGNSPSATEISLVPFGGKPQRETRHIHGDAVLSGSPGARWAPPFTWDDSAGTGWMCL